MLSSSAGFPVSPLPLLHHTTHTNKLQTAFPASSGSTCFGATTSPRPRRSSSASPTSASSPLEPQSAPVVSGCPVLLSTRIVREQLAVSHALIMHKRCLGFFFFSSFLFAFWLLYSTMHHRGCYKVISGMY